MSWFLKDPPDFSRHNAEVADVWRAYHARCPSRLPVSIYGSVRNLIQNPALNTTGYTFEDFFSNPEAQVQCQLAYQKWHRHNVLCDLPMGVPPDGWTLMVDFQNSYDAGWFGCPMHYDGNAVPDTTEILKDNKRKLYDLPCPDLLQGGLMGRAMEFFDYMHDRCRSLEFEGRPVRPPRTIPSEGCDGPLDAAYKLRGAAEVCTDMLEDPDYYHDLMGFITDALIKRMRAVREWRWQRFPDSPDKGKFQQPNFYFADDAIVLLSLDQYKEFVLPYHERLVHAFSDGGPTRVHLCGDATRFFRFLRDRLNVQSFDTGFPVAHGWLRKELGPDVEICGGPTIMTVKEGPVTAIREQVRAICASGIMEGGRFIMIAANNMAPGTPVEHVVALYEAAKHFGRYGVNKLPVVAARHGRTR